MQHKTHLSYLYRLLKYGAIVLVLFLSTLFISCEELLQALSPETYTVHFDAQGGTLVPGTGDQSVEADGLAVRPPAHAYRA